MTCTCNTTLFSLFSLALAPFFMPLAIATADDPTDTSTETLDPAILTIDRIYDGSDFSGKSFSGKWLRYGIHPLSQNEQQTLEKACLSVLNHKATSQQTLYDS